MGKKRWIILLLLFALALTLRLSVAHFLANDEPNDGIVYAQLARNVIEQQTYSLAAAPPYDPTFIRLPGYPLFIAFIYLIFGHGNNEAVRLVQALLDAASCALIACLAFIWQPLAARKWHAAALALALIAVCPFVAIYTATILTETLTTFLVLALVLLATLALKAESWWAQLLWWACAGLCGGALTIVRPDGGLFVAGVGLTLVIVRLCGARDGSNSDAMSRDVSDGEVLRQQQQSRARLFMRRVLNTLACGAVLTLVTASFLVPWTLRNERVFHLFQPLAPVYANMPDEFVARGYFRWVRTWIDDERDIEPLLWTLDDKPIKIEQVPDKAFDTPDERERVAALLNAYNHPPPDASDDQAGEEKPGESDGDNADNGDSADNTDEADETDKQEDQTDNKADESGADESKNGADNSSSDATDEGQAQLEADAAAQPVQMTPEIDAGFAQIADERISRAPVRYYCWLPVKRAAALWFDTHTQYYRFSGELFPLDDLDTDERQQYWLPLFAALVWIYTLLGVAGAVMLWRWRRLGTWRWLLLTLLLIVPRLAFMSTLENPEPRYVVELFALLPLLGGVALSSIRSGALIGDNASSDEITNDDAASTDAQPSTTVPPASGI